MLRGPDQTEYVRPISFLKVTSIRKVKHVKSSSFRAEVDKILDSKTDNSGHTSYLVHWKNTLDTLNEWVSEHDYEDYTPFEKFHALKRSLSISSKKRHGNWKVHKTTKARR